MLVLVPNYKKSHPEVENLLSLPVRSYLVPTPMKGGVEPTPSMISKTVNSTNVNSGRPLELSTKGRKPVELMI